MAIIIGLIATIITYAFYATIWYAAICYIKEYHRKHPKEEKKMFDFNPGEPKNKP